MTNEIESNGFNIIMPTEDLLGGETLQKGELLTEEQIDIELDLSINLDDSAELIIDSYINSLEEGNDTSLTDITVDKVSKDGDGAKILGAVFKIDTGTGGEFNADDMVKVNMDIDSDKNTTYLSEESTKSQVPPSFSKRDIEGLASLLATAKGNMQMSHIDKEIKKISAKLKETVKAEQVIRIEIREIEEEVHALSERFKDLSVAEKELELLNKGKQDLSVIMMLKERGISPMQVTNDLAEVRNRVSTLEVRYKELNSLQGRIAEEQVNLRKQRQSLLGKVEEVMGNLDYDSAEKDIISKGSKVVGIEFGNKLISKDFKEAPVFVECQCGKINHFEVDDIPRYRGIPIEEYKEFKSKIHDYSRNAINNLEYDGLSNLNEPRLICSGCNKHLLFTPSILNDFVKRSFARETATIEKYKVKKLSALTDYNHGEIIMYLSENSFPSDYLKDLGVLKYYESKVRSVNIDPLAELQSDLSLTDKEERIVKLLNPNSNEEMVSTYLRSHNNLIKSINGYLDRLLKNNLKEKDNPTSDNDIKKNNLTRAMRRFIVNNRWLLVSFCVIKQIPTMELQDRISNAYKNQESIRKFRNELFNFFIEHVIDSIIEGKDIVYVDTNRSTNLLEGSSTALPHQVFFNRYRKLISVYFKVRSKRTNSLSKLETFKEVLTGVHEIPKIENKEIANLQSESLVSKILKDIDDMIEKDLTKDVKLRASIYDMRAKITKSIIKSQTSLRDFQYEDEKVFAWVAHEVKNNLENPVELNTNDEIYGNLYK